MAMNTLSRLASDDGSGRDNDWRQWSAEVDGMADRVIPDTNTGARQSIPWGLSPEAARLAPEADRRSIGRYGVRGVRVAGIETNFGFVMQAELPRRLN